MSNEPSRSNSAIPNEEHDHDDGIDNNTHGDGPSLNGRRQQQSQQQQREEDGLENHSQEPDEGGDEGDDEYYFDGSVQDDYDIEEFRSIVLRSMMEAALGEVFSAAAEGNDNGGSETMQRSIKCPICSEVYLDYQESDHPNRAAARKNPTHCCSHGATMLFVKIESCPICMEQSDNEPVVAFACGHVVCKDDFVRLGGILGERKPDEHPEPLALPKQTPSEDQTNDYHQNSTNNSNNGRERETSDERRRGNPRPQHDSSFSRRRGPIMGPGGPMDFPEAIEGQEAFMNAVMAGLGVGPNLVGGGFGGMIYNGNFVGGVGGIPFGSHGAFYDEDSEEDEDTDEDLPPLGSREGDNGDDDSTDDDMPQLEDDDSYNDMPPLE
jgi:hypothetical protein